MAASTIQMSTGHMAAAFWKHFKQSPFHIKDSKALQPSVSCLMKAFENLNPPPKQHKAITPQFLRALYRVTGVDA
jgi:hypothetical protein